MTFLPNQGLAVNLAGRMKVFQLRLIEGTFLGPFDNDVPTACHVIQSANVRLTT